MRKLTTEECTVLNISTIIRHYRFSNGSASGVAEYLERLALVSESVEMVGLPRLRLRFTTTRCFVDRVRYWFKCPSCSKGVGKLYASLSANDFRCRHCCRLTYRACQSEDARAEALYRRFRVIEARGGNGAVEEAIQAVKATPRGRRLLRRAAWANITWPPPLLARWDREKQGYDRYIRPLLEGVRT